MRHPKRALTRDIRTRNPKRLARARRELEEPTWPKGVVRVRDVMTRPVLTFRQTMTVGRALGALPVVEHGRVAGILAVGDVLGTVVQMLDEGVISRPGKWGAEA